jgi:hypothetical protein
MRSRSTVVLLSVGLATIAILISAFIFGRDDATAPPPPAPETAPTTAPTTSPEIPAATWGTTGVLVPDVCGPDATMTERIAVRDEDEELRLSDYIPERSPIPRFQPEGFRGPIDGTGLHPPVLGSGVVDGFAQTFLDPDAAGGFTVFALRYATQSAAIQAAAAAFEEEICRGGANPFEVVEEAGVFIAYENSSGSDSSMRWIQGRDLIDVRYSSFGNPDEFLSGLLVVGRETWDAADEQGSSSAA